MTGIFTYAFYIVFSPGVEKVVGWALSYHSMHCSEAVVKDDKLVISSERLYRVVLQYTLDVLPILFF